MVAKFLTTEQVANILQVHPFTILKFIKQGKLRGVKIGRAYRIKEQDVEAFIEERMTQPQVKRQEKNPEPQIKKVQTEQTETQTTPIQSTNQQDYYSIN